MIVFASSDLLNNLKLNQIDIVTFWFLTNWWGRDIIILRSNVIYCVLFCFCSFAFPETQFPVYLTHLTRNMFYLETNRKSREFFFLHLIPNGAFKNIIRFCWDISIMLMCLTGWWDCNCLIVVNCLLLVIFVFSLKLKLNSTLQIWKCQITVKHSCTL